MSTKQRVVEVARGDYKRKVLLLDGEELPFHITEDVQVTAEQGVTLISVDIIVTGDVEVIQRG